MTAAVAAPSGIAGLRPRESVGAALTVGRKDAERGFPTDKDRFWLVWPTEDEARRRPLHPQFARFNAAPPESRRFVLGQLVHARLEECWECRYQAQVAPGLPSHPGRLPVCRGDGVRALRWDGQDFRAVACPADRCEFRRPPAKGRPPCGPHMRFFFRLCWPDAINANPAKIPLPSVLCRFTSGGWATTSNFAGFFEGIRRAADALGYADPSLAGFRFALSLQERSNAERKTRYPTVAIVPTDDPIAFFLAQVEARRRIADRPAVPLLSGSMAVALTDPEERTGAALAADWQVNVPGSGPVDVEAQD